MLGSLKIPRSRQHNELQPALLRHYNMSYGFTFSLRTLFLKYCLSGVEFVLRVGETLCDVYRTYHESHFVGVLDNP